MDLALFHIDGALGLLHRGRVVHDVLAQRRVDLLHGLASAPAGHLVPPDEVHLGAGQVGRRAALPHVQLKPRPVASAGDATRKSPSRSSAEQAMLDRLASTTLADLADETRGLIAEQDQA